MKAYERAQCEAMLSAAARSTIGVLIRTNSSMRARALLYEYRKESRDPTLARLQIRYSPTSPDTDLWAINMEQPDDKSEQNELPI